MFIVDGSDGRHVCSKYHGHTHYYQATMLVKNFAHHSPIDLRWRAWGPSLY